MTTVCGIKQFMDAVVAYRQVGRNADRGTIAALTFADGEVVKTFGLDPCGVNFSNAGGRGRLSLQIVQKRVKARLFSFKKNLDPLLAVEHPAGEVVTFRQG